ncbi:delta-1-pyrroline-5-carboxylate dehydrogenase 12a1 mitochondrial [Phtheirospermum japonicum]|uniref:Delta-1-pyrroline-5-carboxylate dehydrogenase 12a1 mitochondrial n=1 Tax=Phtheirospermum japonicum TaxID=374723 RepID=A0A830BD38_9LAMI|nr:delta-1-pyrroline-5-carboxylate dehydrogenase 12a1 mitochondrial [Phtheirospermum japonicum]
MLGDVTTKAAHRLSQPEVKFLIFFAKLIQRVSPKSYQQAFAEVYVCFLVRSFAVPGNHLGQQSHGFRWPYGPVTIITHFNFPLEIPVLQLMGALYMGNKPLLRVDSKVCVVMEQMLRLLHECGLPLTDVDFINSDGKSFSWKLPKKKKLQELAENCFVPNAGFFKDAVFEDPAIISAGQASESWDDA